MTLCCKRGQDEPESAQKTDVYRHHPEEKQLGLLTALVVALAYVNLT